MPKSAYPIRELALRTGLSAVVGGFAYSAIGSFPHWHGLAAFLGIGLIFAAPVGLPSALIICAAILAGQRTSISRQYLLEFILAAVMTTLSTVVFPYCMTALLPGTNWHRGLWLPIATGAAALAVSTARGRYSGFRLA